MSAPSLSSYSGPLSLHRIPTYSSKAHNAVVSARRNLPSGSFVKESKHGCVTLRLCGQEDNIELPVYGLGSHVEGSVELSKTDAVESVEVKVSQDFVYIPSLRFTLTSLRVDWY
jgi:hypothetical protein